MIKKLLNRSKYFRKFEHFIVWDTLWKKMFLKHYMKSPVNAAHKEMSMIYSAADDYSQVNDHLLNLAEAAIHSARTIRMDNLVKRAEGKFTYPDPNMWPGEHYRLLAAFVQNINPGVVIEIGTERGIGTIALLEKLKENASLTTFDINAWDTHLETVITREDIEKGKVVQYLDDLSQPEIFEKHRQLFEGADLIFVDAAKDGIMEKKFIAHFETVMFKNRPLIIFDDTKTWNMLDIWREISYPKLDMTSFGHFTGTGIVDWHKEVATI